MTLRHFKAFSVIFLILAHSSFLTVSHAQDHARPFPSAVDAFTLKVTPKGLNKLTMVPTGVHTDDESRFIYSGHQKGTNIAAPLLGLPGLIVSSELNSGVGKKRLGQIQLSEANLIEEMALVAITAAFEGSAKGVVREASGSFAPNHVLKISPYATIIQSKQNGTKLHAMIVAQLFEGQDTENPIWKSQFYGEVDGQIDEETLSKPDLLYKRLEQAFDRAAWGFARIALNDFDSYEPIMANGWLAWFRKPGEIPAIRLQATEDRTLLRLPFGAIVAGAGYNITSTQNLKTKPLKKLKDKFKSDFER